MNNTDKITLIKEKGVSVTSGFIEKILDINKNEVIGLSKNQNNMSMLSIRIKNSDPVRDIREAALNTIGKKYYNKYFDDDNEFKNFLIKYLISEHSPIRNVDLLICFYDILTYNSVHFARHVHSIPFVTSNRPDRTNKERTVNDRVNHMMSINLQGLIDMMRKRLCVGKVDHITYYIAYSVKETLKLSNNIIFNAIGYSLVPNCIYRKQCPEFSTCGFFDSILEKNKSNLSINNMSKLYDIYNN